ncbi:DUF2800 domain-containing protein [Ileibacterium valens]|uniref:DUF2800 domain-containing protein n=1 Tax=Ileibacterium valens TaxID=1862668 RepID=UPI002354661C|nr:DUF2800 domain-containing protein [Ileibacterium valens]
MSSHALLSASSASRWIACPPSALLNAKEADQSSEYAEQGTEAHLLCEYKLTKGLGMEAADPTAELKFFDQEMADCTDDYVRFILEQKAEIEKTCKDPLVLIEQRLDFSKFVPEGFGTGDCLIISDNQIQVIDFKYGSGVEVSAEKNPQMMCYALGALLLYDGIYDIESVKMTIFQPRKDSISSFEISKEDLLKWAEEVLSPAAKLAAKGKGDFKAGDHCRFCKIKNKCRKRAEYNLELARYDFEPGPELEDLEVEAILAKADGLISWINDIKEYALNSALQGKKWEDWKIVEGRSVRKFKSEEETAKIVQEAGYEPYANKLLGITEMTKLLGKAKFNELLKDQIVKPKGKPTLVSRDDKRKEINTAQADFGGEE